MKDSKLSIFVDESGDFGFKAGSSKRYGLTLVFHDESNDISSNLARIKDLPTFHAGPLIRKEPPFEHFQMVERAKIWKTFFIFFERLPIKIKTFIFIKRDFDSSHEKMERKMLVEFSLYLEKNREFFSSFKSIDVYYDRGQEPITVMLKKGFKALGLDFSLKDNVKAEEHRLIQVADMVVEIQLVQSKLEHNELTKSEKAFFNLSAMKTSYKKALKKKTQD